MRRPAPTFSLISAVYNVAAYLPEFLESLAGLDGGLDDVEVLFVSDGSVDESDEIIRTWIAATGAPARLIRKGNGGPASARNEGLDIARGTWVSFPDPDDVLGSGYLVAVRSFLASGCGAEAAVSAIATKVVQFTDVVGNARDDHVLGYRYHDGSKCVHLEEAPRLFHTHVASGFYRRELVERAGLRFDSRLRVAFDDAAFAAEYLLGVDDPVLGIVPDAVYAYRKRADGTVASMWSQSEKYTMVPEHGYVRLLRLRPHPPSWLQNLVLYDLWWFFYEYEQPGSPNATIGREVADAFLAHLDEVLELIDERVLYAYPVHPLGLQVRTALAARKTGRLLRPEARVTEMDPVARRARVSYFSIPDEPCEPEEVVTLDGNVRQPLESRDRPIEYYGQTFIIERELLLDAEGTLMIQVDGEVLPLTKSHSGTGALFPWEHAAPTEIAVADHVPEGPRESRDRGASGPAMLRARLGALAREPWRIRPAFARRVQSLRRRLPTQRFRRS